MRKLNIINQLRQKIIAIVRASSEDEAFLVFETLIDSGITAIELSFTTPYPHKILEQVSKTYGKDCLIGAGTILDSSSCRIAILSGAQYIVTPTVNAETIMLANRYSVPIFPGVFTPTEMELAASYGADIVKLFPASAFRPEYIKEIKSPLPNIEFIPTGGVNKDNISQWKKAGAFAYGVGGALTAGIKTGDINQVKSAAKELLSLLSEN
ncbi:MAG TPA: bifunctional 4-hydroxy-2-oxoglutarate aldolase/2-dehydro-3-deoxy-phosphogluconate aldolase [Clostridia bacterium]